MWQTLETKARFIALVDEGRPRHLVAGDVELAALSYAEVKALASGNPLVIESRRGRGSQALDAVLGVAQPTLANESEVGRLPMMIEALEKKVALYARDAARIEPQTMRDIVVELAGTQDRGPDGVGEATRGLVRTAKEEVAHGQPDDQTDRQPVRRLRP
ncbi:MAG: hypothetical protein IPL15_10150, partial [Comamonadaceae bacterium]|nr:hypothetical protein [Comamonadaceae bacterium]